MVLFAFLDDVYAVCGPNRSREVFDLLVHHLWRVARILLHTGKTRVWNKSGVSPPNVEQVWNPEGVKVFPIDHWFASVRHGPVVISLRFTLFALSASQRSLTLFLSGLLRNPSRPTLRTVRAFRTTCRRISLFFLMMFLFLLPLRLWRHFASSGPLSCEFLQCCSIPIHQQCITDLIHESSQSVICPACNAQSPSSVDFLHFQHLCCVHHVGAPAGECMICSDPQSTASSPSVPCCCRQRVHYECLPWSVHSCGDRCPSAHRTSSPSCLTLLWRPPLNDVPIDFSASPANSSLNSLSVPDNMPLPPSMFPLCCLLIPE